MQLVSLFRFQSSTERNIAILYALRALQTSWVIIPTLVLFYQSNSVSLRDVLILKAAMSAAVLILEIPSGYFADRIGRKNTLLIAACAWLVSTLVFCVSTSFFGFVIAELMVGVAISLLSGADTAFVYDTLKAAGQEERYVKVEGRLGGIAGYSEATGGLVGAWLASFALIYPFYLLCFINVAAIGLVLLLEEPERESGIHAGPDYREMMRYIQSTFWSDRAIFWLTINGSLGGVATFLIVWYSQAYMKLIDLPVAYFGVAWAAFHVVMGSFSLQAASLERKVGAYRTFLLLVVLTAISYMGLGWSESVAGLSFVALLYASRGMRTVLVRKHLNHRLDSGLRATALSIYSFIFRILWLVFGPLFGFLSDIYSLSTAFVAAGVLLGGGMLLTYLAMVRWKSLSVSGSE